MFGLPGGGVGVAAAANSWIFLNTHSIHTTGDATNTAGHVNLGRPANWQVNLSTTPFTWAIWFRYAGREGRILSCRRDADAQFDLTLSSGGLSLVIGDNFMSGGSGLADGNWHHVVVTVRDEGGTNVARMFVDGNTTSIANTSAGSLITTTIDWLIGHRRGSDNTNYASGAYSNMYFAHLTAWSVGMTGAQAAELYNLGVPMDPMTHSLAASLVNYLPLGSADTSPTLPDRKGAIVGTMVNTGTIAIEAAPAFSNLRSTLFQGTDDVVSLGQPADLTRNLSNTEFTISAWIYPTSLAAQRWIAAKAEPFGVGGYGWILAVNTDGSLFGYFGDVGKTTSSAASAIAINTWYHVAYTVRNIAGTYTANLWINGVKVGLDVTAPGSTTASGVDCRIGAGYVLDSPDTLFPFVGRIEEVTFWSVGLTAAELLALYNSGKPTNPKAHSQAANLLHWYRMGDNDTFPTITDRKGSANGTCTNMVDAATNFVLAVP